MLTNITVSVFLLASCLLLPAQQAKAIHSDHFELKPFLSTSFQQILDSRSGQPSMLTIWSKTCTICMQKMPLISELQKTWPGIHMITLSTDDIADSDEIRKILVEHNLNTAENWIFADSNAQKLRYTIDPKWFGELPRTYFIDKNRQRKGISGGLSREQYEIVFRELLDQPD